MARKSKLINRILWNRRPTGMLDAGDIDEIVIHDPVMVHVEQMDAHCWWIGIYLDHSMGRRWSGNFTCDSRGRMRFTQQDCDIKWDRDNTHEREAD